MEKFATGVVDTGGKFAAGVVDLLLVSFPPVSTSLAKLVEKFASGVVDTGGKFAAVVVDTGGHFAAGIVDLRISPRIFKTIQNGPNGILCWGETDT